MTETEQAEALDRFRRASAPFAARLELVAPEQWDWPTPCAEWNVRQLALHMARGNLILARAIGADERLSPELVGYVHGHLAEIYAGLPDTPADPAAPGRYFGVPAVPGPGVSAQDRLLLRMGRTPGRN